jgi:hypothetical protein
MRVLVALVLVTSACTHHDAAPCDPPTNFGCDPARQCETEVNSAPLCLPPVVVTGRVIASDTLQPIGNARVLLLDTDGVPVVAAATTLNDGTYSVRLPSPRNADESPMGQVVSVRIDAAGYQRFPGGFRTGFTVDTRAAQLDATADQWAVIAPDIQLVGQPGGTGVLTGTVQLPTAHEPVLVVAEPSTGGGAGSGFSGLADGAGIYQIFSLPPGTYTVSAYAKGESYSTAPAAVSAGEIFQVNMKISGPAASHVTGNVTYLGAATGTTSVLLAVESTYYATADRLDVPVGLRATVGGTGGFIIDAVPDGTYVLLPAFETDGLVRDQSPASTPIAEVVVSDFDVAVSATQNVLPAIPLVGPGATGITQVTAAPILTWQDITGENTYHVTVYDALGRVAWTHDEPSHNGGTPSVPYAGPLLTGMFYRWQVAALDGAGHIIDSSEDLLGVFVKPAQ